MAERDMNDRLKIGYMQHRIGDSFDAIISGVTDNACMLKSRICASAVPFRSKLLGDDYFIYDKKNYRLFGEISAKTYQIGDLRPGNCC